LIFTLAACDGTATPSPTSPSPPTTVVVPPVANPPANPPSSGSGDSIAGHYTLNITVGPGCNVLPEIARNRTYAASIDRAGDTAYVVTLSEASFLKGSICTAAPSRLDCNQFAVSRTGDVLRFDLINENDDGHGGHIVEQIPPGTWLELIGSATGGIQGGSITAAGSAIVWYCPTVMGYPFPCRSFVSCQFDDLRLTFTRK
jgi:hypothetical protein